MIDPEDSARIDSPKPIFTKKLTDVQTTSPTLFPLAFLGDTRGRIDDPHAG